jgi:hypothetical protein
MTLSTGDSSRIAQRLLLLLSCTATLILLHLSQHTFAFVVITTQRKSVTFVSTCNEDDGHHHQVPRLLLRLNASSPKAKSSNLNADGKCKFGTKEYWDAMYSNTSSSVVVDDNNGDNLPSDKYSWYCGWTELQPFWDMLITPLITDGDDNKQSVKVLIAGIGNDITPIQMYDDGWTNMIAFDYSEDGVCRAKELFGPDRLLSLQQQENDCNNVGNDNDDEQSTVDATISSSCNGGGGSAKLITADCRSLPIPNGHIDAILDKGTLDAIYITGPEVFQDSVKELTRVTSCDGGMIVCISAVIPQEVMLDAFGSNSCYSSSRSDNGEECCWETVHDGGLAFADGGEATIDLGANLYSFVLKTKEKGGEEE